MAEKQSISLPVEIPSKFQRRVPTFTQRLPPGRLKFDYHLPLYAHRSSFPPDLEQKRQALGENWRFIHMENLPLTELLKARKLIEQLESFNTSPEFCKYVEEIEATLDRAISLIESPFGEGSTNVDPVTSQHKRESSKRR